MDSIGYTMVLSNTNLDLDREKGCKSNSDTSI
jgi:hypothetical protein